MERVETGLRIFFWNLKNNSNAEWVVKTIQENDVDVALFAEYHGTDFKTVLTDLKGDYTRHDGKGGCDKITLLCRRSVETKVKVESTRYTLYTCIVNDVSYNIVGLHLQSNPRSDSNDRKNEIRKIVYDICVQEKKDKNRKTVVIGDFNCNPFSEEIIQKDAFNAVLFRRLIEKNEYVTYQGTRIRKFYNPILLFLSEEENIYGSFYYPSSNSAPLYWNSFDQVLVRKELANRIESMNYIKEISGRKLIKDIAIDGRISDHLPLLVSIGKGKME